MKHDIMTVHEVAELTGITIRTLHYYDEIGLLKSSEVSEAKYRLYTESDLERLQQILFYKEIGFSLKEIKQFLSVPVYDKKEILKRHLEVLTLQKKRLGELITLVNDAIAGNGSYSFAVFSKSEIMVLKEKYKNEVRERWTNTNEYKEFLSRFSPDTEQERIQKWKDFILFSQHFFEQLADCENRPPENDTVQEFVQEWKDYISENLFHCSNEALCNLGDLYQMDNRFAVNINRFGNGDLSAFFNKVIKNYCSKVVYKLISNPNT